MLGAGQDAIRARVLEEVAAQEGIDVGDRDLVLLRLSQLPCSRGAVAVGALLRLATRRDRIIERSNLAAVGRPLRVEEIVVPAMDAELIETDMVFGGGLGGEGQCFRTNLSLAGSTQDG